MLLSSISHGASNVVHSLEHKAADAIHSLEHKAADALHSLEDKAASKLQAVHRGHRARKDHHDAHVAATRVQSIHRGRKARKDAAFRKQGQPLPIPRSEAAYAKLETEYALLKQRLDEVQRKLASLLAANGNGRESGGVPATPPATPDAESPNLFSRLSRLVTALGSPDSSRDANRESRVRV